MKKKYKTTIAGLLLVVILAFKTNAVTMYQWQNDSDIVVDITSPTAYTYLSINDFLGFTATASDPDCERKSTDGGETWTNWYSIGDEVVSGTNSYDCHMVWTCNMGELLIEYGNSALYAAPDYGGTGVRYASIAAYADDINTGDETPTNRGYNDSEQHDSIYIVIWEVGVVADQTGPLSTNYDGMHLTAELGGDHIGWNIPNNPTGCTNYNISTQIVGTVHGTGAPTGSFAWKQFWRGNVQYMTVSSHPSWVDIDCSDEWEEEVDVPYYLCQDTSTMHGGIDVDEIFFLDPPGLDVGASNNLGIGSPNNWIAIRHDSELKTYVECNGVRVSNFCYWYVYFELVESGGIWVVVCPF